MDQAEARASRRLDSKAAAALYSVAVNLVLIGAKLLVGLLTGSVAILADAAHAWGHAKAENISSLIQMFLLGATCIAIVIESVRRLVVPGIVRVAWYSFVVVLAAIVIDIVVSRYLQRVSQAHGGSAALDADALHFASDLWASLAVLIGITLVAVFDFQVADPLAGIAVAIIIGTTAIERILGSDPRLHGYHTLRARQAGKHVMLDVSVHVDGSLSLAQAHEVGHAVSARIRRELPLVSDAVVHVEPVDDDAHG